MKKILSLLVFLPIMVIGQTQTENYVKNTTYKVATATSIPTPTAQQATQTITYYDGLGRPIQQVAHQQSGSGKDIVTPIEYDGFGRQDKEYLPYVPTAPASLDYKPSALADVLTFYDDVKYDADFPGMSTSNANPIIQINPYSQKGFEDSPLNRVLKQAAPGNDWKLGNGHEIKFEYETNTDADLVRQFGVSFVNGNTEAPHLEDNGIYATSQLYKTVTKDENWMPNQTYPSDHTTQEFKNKEGKVVLKRTFDVGKWHDTYYVYDDYGNLTYVLPPKLFTYHSITQPLSGLSIYLSTDYDYFSFFASPNPNSYADLYLTQTGENSLNLYFWEYGFTPGSPLMSGKIADLNLTPSPQDIILCDIMVSDVNGNLVVGGKLSIKNGELHITAEPGVVAYPDSNGEFYFSATINLPSLQANYTPQALDRSVFNDLIYQYKYDKRNRLVEKKLPGKEWEYIVYDKLDRPVLTQDAILKTQNKWLFTKYDAFSRPVYTGEYVNTSETTRTTVQALADAATIMFETKQGINTINGTTIYYNNTAFPNTNINLFTINYYDDYNFDLNGGTAATSYSITPITNAKSLATGTKVRILGTTNWTSSVIYYDSKGRPIYNYSKNDYLGTTSTVKTKLDFVGKVLETTSTHARNSVTTTLVDVFTYDQAGRLTQQTQAINGTTTPEIIVANTYDELGQLTSKKVGGKTTQGLQKVDYGYNIRGWLKNINDPNNLNQDNDLFAFGLNYNTVVNSSIPTYNQNKPLYNGNISSTSWKTSNVIPVLKQYNYSYDALNRFKAAWYAENNSFNSKFNESISSYDRNGNIMMANRYMQHPTNANSGTGIDYLTYTYDSGNKLMKVLDYYGDEGFKDGNKTGDDYSYDANGNMTKDLNKGIGTASTNGITYNHLNLPTQITLAAGTIDYVYDATGVKQRKIVSPGTTTDYAGGFQYESNILKFFPQPEGYVDCSSGNFNYIYQYKDHLGNVRLSYADKDNNGTIVGANTTTVFSDDFESATGWDGSGSSIWGWPVSGFDSSIKRTGIYSAKLDPGTEWIRAVHSNEWIPINNTQTTDYIFSCWVYLENVSGNRANIFLFMNTAGETNYYSIVDSESTYITGKWVYLEKRVSVPANISKLNIRIDSQNAGIVWFDDVSIRRVNTTSEIVEENNYYPFGLKHKDSNNVVTSTNPGQKYKYNGKELQDELGLNVYDMDARNYDPALGRFMNIDPMAESYYQHTPYNFVGSNPIIRTDPTGMDWYTDEKGNQTYNKDLTKDNASSILNSDKNEKYSGTTATENVSNDEGSYTLSYNADGSISSSNTTRSTTNDGIRVFGVGGDAVAGSGFMENDRGSGSIQADTGDVGMLFDFGQLLGDLVLNWAMSNPSTMGWAIENKYGNNSTLTNATTMSASVPETVIAQRYDYVSTDPMRGAQSTPHAGYPRDTSVVKANAQVVKLLNTKDSLRAAKEARVKNAEYNRKFGGY
ncbi:DUF6443 domain-containing protein [Flavobacterium eburneipallidum]|uniref:DUF6443 domain-containing protein n=1 Tax=Flavobacterium eburneipallidum TaxID=3003263 RepID=UPI002482674C|nr:DUF6443 domain-containing protein [Flavobacterium eburneipallidum]